MRRTDDIWIDNIAGTTKSQLPQPLELGRRASICQTAFPAFEHHGLALKFERCAEYGPAAVFEVTMSTVG